MKKIKIKASERDKLPTWPVGYGSKLRVMVPYPENPREGRCDACGRQVSEGEINITQIHHFLYAYKHATIKKDPLKVLENAVELDYGCHSIADALRELLRLKKENLWKIVRVAKLMPESMKAKLDWVARSYLAMRKTDKVKTLNDFSNV